MHVDFPAIEALEQLAASADIRDRAFVAGVLSLRRGAEDSRRAALLYERVREAARSRHEEVRQRIKDGRLDKRAFVTHLREAPLEIRDHLVEEVLDIAYGPLEEASIPRDGIRYCPSGIAEILFMLEHADLGPDKTFVDLGSGLGKVVLIVALLTGARAYGVEIDSRLVSQAASAARALGVDNAEFIQGDIRSGPLPTADIYYLYIPVIHSTAVVSRLLEIAKERKVIVFSPALDLARLPWLKARPEASYWLKVYEGPAPFGG